MKNTWKFYEDGVTENLSTWFSGKMYFAISSNQTDTFDVKA
mgnify:CR=1 FL=1